MSERDIVERLREACVGKPAKIPWPHYLLHEAADEIERLRTALAQADLRTGFAMEGIRDARSK